MSRIKRPDYFGEWNDEHINWVVDVLKINHNEISSTDIQNVYRRKGDGGKKPLAQDYRNLMRLLVKNRLARVTKGFSEIGSYRICLVSDDYPYIQDELLNIVIFYPSRLKFPPTEEQFSTIYPYDQMTWTPQHKIVWKHVYYWWHSVFKAFTRHIYCGGDLEDLSSYFTKSHKERFILQINQFICEYKVIKIGWKEIKGYAFEWILPDGSSVYGVWKSPEHLFTDMLNARSICMFVGHFSTKENHIKPATKADHINAIRKSLKVSDESIRNDRVRLLVGNYFESKEAFYCEFSTGHGFYTVLERTNDPLVKEAVDRCASADKDWFKYYEHCYRDGTFT
jgi:hypothetical protein